MEIDQPRPWHQTGIFRGTKNGMKTSTAVYRVLSIRRWMELFMVQNLRSGQWNTGPALLWLLEQPHLDIAKITRSPDGVVEVFCEQGLVGEHLKIGWPTGYDPVPLITGMRTNIALDSMPIGGNA